jgi:hypothetical protein
MSILDFTSGLFRDPANLRSFVDNSDQALDEAGLSDATPQQVHDLLPVVAESMPPDHPLQTVVHAADPVRALAELDVDELLADVHHHHHETAATELVDKALGSAECRPDEDREHAQTIHVAHWDLVDEGDKALGEPLAPVDDYPDARDIGEPGDDHAPDDGGVDLDISGVVWGEAVE